MEIKAILLVLIGFLIVTSLEISDENLEKLAHLHARNSWTDIQVGVGSGNAFQKIRASKAFSKAGVR